MSYAKYSKDNDGIVTITFDNPDSKVNVMNTTFIDALGEALGKLDSDIDDVKGVIVASGKDTFFAGGDLDQIVDVTEDTVGEYFGDVMRVKSLMRRIEQLGRPVVAAINGAALGGGYEICQACHHRIALDSPKVVVGLPEVTLGLLPGVFRQSLLDAGEAREAQLTIADLEDGFFLANALRRMVRAELKAV